MVLVIESLFQIKTVQNFRVTEEEKITPRGKKWQTVEAEPLELQKTVFEHNQSGPPLILHIWGVREEIILLLLYR